MNTKTSGRPPTPFDFVSSTRSPSVRVERTADVNVDVADWDLVNLPTSPVFQSGEEGSSYLVVGEWDRGEEESGHAVEKRLQGKTIIRSVLRHVTSKTGVERFVHTT